MEENLQKITQAFQASSPTGGAVEKNLPGNAGDTAPHVDSAWVGKGALEGGGGARSAALALEIRGQRSLAELQPSGAAQE